MSKPKPKVVVKMDQAQTRRAAISLGMSIWQKNGKKIIPTKKLREIVLKKLVGAKLAAFLRADKKYVPRVRGVAKPVKKVKAPKKAVKQKPAPKAKPASKAEVKRIEKAVKKAYKPIEAMKATCPECGAKPKKAHAATCSKSKKPKAKPAAQDRQAEAIAIEAEAPEADNGALPEPVPF